MVPLCGRRRSVDRRALIGSLLVLVAISCPLLDGFLIQAPTRVCHQRTHPLFYTTRSTSRDKSDKNPSRQVRQRDRSKKSTASTTKRRSDARQRSGMAKPNANTDKQVVRIVPCATPTVLGASLQRLMQFHRQLSTRDNEWDASMCTLLGRLLASLRKVEEENVYPLVDTLQYVANIDHKLRETGELYEEEKAALRLLASAATTLIDQRRTEMIRTLRPSRMVDLLRAFHVLGYHNDSSRILPATVRMQHDIYQKCSLGNSLAELSPGDMSMALKTLSSQQQPTSLGDLESTFAIALMRRFRKQSLRQAAPVQHLVRAVKAVTTLYAQNSTLSTTNEDNNPAVKFQSEAKLMVYTVFREIMQKVAASQATMDKESATSYAPREETMTLPQLTDLVSCMAAMGVLNTARGDPKGDDKDSAFKTDWEDALSAQNHNLLERARVEELSRFLMAVEGTRCPDLALSTEFGRELGKHFSVEVELTVQLHTASRDTKLDFPIKPKSANSILRIANHRWEHNHTVMEAFGNAAQTLLAQEGFLKLCHAEDLANFATFLDKTRYLQGKDNQSKNRKDPLLAIAERVLDKSIAEETTPSQASRMLSAFTSVIVARGRDRKIIRSEAVVYEIATTESYVLSDLFHTLGGHLLTDELSTKDISSALYAYAKASYVHDMGIFDHLTGLMASRLHECTIRQLSQGLWACGKMALWEQRQQQLDSSDLDNGQAEAKTIQHLPPFLPSANLMADFLSRRKNRMTSQDIAQVTWALGRLQSVQKPHGNGYSTVMDKFLSRAKILASQLTIDEASNILWGMSMTGYKNCGHLVRPIADRIIDLHEFTTEKATPIEAGSIMMALGRMGIGGNEELFYVLSNDILDQIDVASAQAIANALYAHQAVHMTPPRRLLDCWATDRLGVVTVPPGRKI